MMVTITVYIISVTAFGLSWHFLHMLDTLRLIIEIALQAAEILADHRLGDNVKGRESRRAALQVLFQFCVLVSKIFLLAIFVALPPWGAVNLGLMSWTGLLAFTMRPDVLLGTTIVLLAFWGIWRRGHKMTKVPSRNDESDYSTLDRVIHNVAFGSHRLQRIMLDLETWLYRKRWSKVKADSPVFITSLPRAGTMIALQVLSRLSPFATHTYRDMPFVLTPYLWARISLALRRRSRLRERAHGDGLSISEDSPEAFDEVVWLRAFPQKYRADGIMLWKRADFTFYDFFYEHMKKVISLHHNSGFASEVHYLSKNNANVARISVLKEMFPEAKILVMFRDPIEQSISMLRQHLNFSMQHERTPFVRKYMEDIGHYEFGLLHRPILFPGLKDLIADLEPESINYWIAYWISAFEHILCLEGVNFVSYERFCSGADKSLAKLCRHLEIDVPHDEIQAAAALLRPPPVRRSGLYTVRDDLWERAMRLYQAIERRCILR